MEMDIPEADELEWLEANSHLHVDDDEEEYNYFFHDDVADPTIPSPGSDLSVPPVVKPPTADVAAAIDKQKRVSVPVKRPRSDGLVLESGSEEKRGRKVLDDDDDDEDWLRRHSPPPRAEDADVEVVEEAEKEKVVSRFAFEIKGDCVPITGIEGERVYAKLKGIEERESLGRFDFKTHSNDHGLISEPIHVLLQRVETESFTKAVQASVESQSDADLSSKNRSDTFFPKTPVVNEKLWVDKYSPSSFMELLSDEKTNREVLSWLKQWDTCVFGSEIRATTDDVLSSLRHHSSVAQQQRLSHRTFPGKYSNKSFSGKYGDSQQSQDTFKGQQHSEGLNNGLKGTVQLGNKNIKGSSPPEHKILLLCGPPGLGKTTLAHVAAKHCGYRVVEINASDDRSSSTIEGKILDVVQMNSIMADSKPKCLVIDEIDGALGDGKGAVDVILKMLSAEKKSATGKENTNDDQHGKSSSKKKTKAASLSRPVICICNDLYAPALRPLRQVAQVHVFVQPTVSRVVNRLKYICNKEGLKTSSIALGALAEYTECDIRSCLNTLQFLHKKKEALNVLEIESQVVGKKDTVKSVFDIWKEIFQKRKAKNERKLDKGGSSKFKDFDYMHSLVSSRGDYDLILDGVHENILHLSYHDPGMHKTVKCLHSLGVSDLVHQYIMRTQQMSLLVYQPTAVVYIRSLVAQNQRPNIEWPKSFHRCRIVSMEKMENFRLWHNKILPHISRHISTKSLVEETVSPLLHILSPPKLRPVAMHLLSEKEKNDVIQLVNTMVAYSVTYKNVKPDHVFNHPSSGAVGDTSILSFDPPLASLITFKGYTSHHFALAAAVKQILVHEVERQRILQSNFNRSVESTDLVGKGKHTQEGKKTGLLQSLSSGSGNIQKANNSSFQKQSKATVVTTASLEVASPVEAKKRKNSSFNFFERFKKLSSNSSQETNNGAREPATQERDSRPLLFKFNEGYTNAVKRPVRMREFLL